MLEFSARRRRRRRFATLHFTPPADRQIFAISSIDIFMLFIVVFSTLRCQD